MVLAFTAYFTRAYWLPSNVDLCFSGEANVPLEDAIPRTIGHTDVLFAFDQSGSMGGMIQGAKEDATRLMRTLAARIGRERFGVAGFSDYIDFPYRMYQPLTGELEAVQQAINDLTLVDGGDIPEAYGRMMYESYADPAIGWREDARRYLVIFGDSYPHDPDAGRDELLGTSDDLILENVLNQMSASETSLIYVADPGVGGDASLLQQWADWTEVTGGSTVRCSSS